jgi:hypothetical protein
MTPEEIQALVAKSVAEAIKASTPAPAPAPTEKPATPTALPQLSADEIVAKLLAAMPKPEPTQQPDIAALINSALDKRDLAAKRQAALSTVPVELQPLMPADLEKMNEFIASETYKKMAAPFQAAPATDTAPEVTDGQGQPGGDGETVPPEGTPTAPAAKPGANFEENKGELYKQFESIFEGL